MVTVPSSGSSSPATIFKSVDYEMVEWLEDYLRRFRGAIIMITHDRYFLDSVCNRIVEVDKGQTYSYDTNYSVFCAISVISSFIRSDFASLSILQRISSSSCEVTTRLITCSSAVSSGSNSGFCGR